MTDPGGPPATCTHPTSVTGSYRSHADAVDVLTSWAAPDAAQEALRRQYLAHLLAHPDATRRDGPPAHLTASALVLDFERRHTLLVLHRKARAWFQPGGHLEAHDDSLAAGAAREAREETGIRDLILSTPPLQLDRHRLADDFGRCREHFDVRYLAIAPFGARPELSAESMDLRWWPVDALPAAASATGVADLVAAALTAP